MFLAKLRFGVFLVTRRVLSGPICQTRAREVSWVHPTLLPNRAIRHNLGSVRDGLFPSTRHDWGFPLHEQLDHVFPRPYLPVQHSVYSSVLCIMALSTFPHGNALPFRYLARRVSTRVGL